MLNYNKFELDFLLHSAFYFSLLRFCFCSAKRANASSSPPLACSNVNLNCGFANTQQQKNNTHCLHLSCHMYRGFCRSEYWIDFGIINIGNSLLLFLVFWSDWMGMGNSIYIGCVCNWKTCSRNCLARTSFRFVYLRCASHNSFHIGEYSTLRRRSFWISCSCDKWITALDWKISSFYWFRSRISSRWERILEEVFFSSGFRKIFLEFFPQGNISWVFFTEIFLEFFRSVYVAYDFIELFFFESSRRLTWFDWLPHFHYSVIYLDGLCHRRNKNSKVHQQETNEQQQEKVATTRKTSMNSANVILVFVSSLLS